jgi:hypothetical protein
MFNLLYWLAKLFLDSKGPSLLTAPFAPSQSTNPITSKVMELANKAVTNIATAVMSRRKVRF